MDVCCRSNHVILVLFHPRKHRHTNFILAVSYYNFSEIIRVAVLYPYSCPCFLGSIYFFSLLSLLSLSHLYDIIYFILISTTQKFIACLVCVFKQQFSVFLEISMGEKVCENACNIV